MAPLNYLLNTKLTYGGVLRTLGVVLVIIFGFWIGNQVTMNSQISDAVDDAKSVWIDLQKASDTGTRLPTNYVSERGRSYIILRNKVNSRRGDGILAVSYETIADDKYLVIYQSGKCAALTKEETANLLMDEVKSNS